MVSQFIYDIHKFFLYGLLGSPVHLSQLLHSSLLASHTKHLSNQQVLIIRKSIV